MLSSVVRAARASSARAAASPVSALGAIRGVSVLPNDADFNLVDRDALHPTDPLKRKPEIIKLPKAEQQQTAQDRFRPPPHPVELENRKAIAKLTAEQKHAIGLEGDRSMAAMMEEDAVGDKIVAMHKRQRLRARAAVIWNGVESHVDLSRRDRSSPIYFNVKKPSDRLPRVPMPSDLGNEVSPTAALLHAYRMQHARMFINENRHQRMVEHFTKYQNLDEIDLEIEEIEGADNEGIKLLMESLRADFKAFPGMGHAEKARVLLAIKKVIPDVVHKAQVEVVRTRRRKK